MLGPGTWACTLAAHSQTACEEETADMTHLRLPSLRPWQRVLAAMCQPAQHTGKDGLGASWSLPTSIDLQLVSLRLFLLCGQWYRCCAGLVAATGPAVRLDRLGEVEEQMPHLLLLQLLLVPPAPPPWQRRSRSYGSLFLILPLLLLLLLLMPLQLHQQNNLHHLPLPPQLPSPSLLPA